MKRLLAVAAWVASVFAGASATGVILLFHFGIGAADRHWSFVLIALGLAAGSATVLLTGLAVKVRQHLSRLRRSWLFVGQWWFFGLAGGLTAAYFLFQPWLWLLWSALGAGVLGFVILLIWDTAKMHEPQPPSGWDGNDSTMF